MRQEHLFAILKRLFFLKMPNQDTNGEINAADLLSAKRHQIEEKRP